MGIDTYDRTIRPGLDLLDDHSHDAIWLAVSMASAGLVYVTYVFSHPYPAYGGGLFLTTAEAIIDAGYSLPVTIHGYTTGGIPFGYPPLMFYLTAMSIDWLVLDPLALTLYLPGLVVIASLVPYYGIAKELTGEAHLAGLATVLFGVTPAVLRWHISAGGLVRAPALLFSLTTIYAGVKLFSTHETRWLALSVSGFGATVLTHPTYTSFVVLSFLVLFIWLDRSLTGLVIGAIVGVGGLLLTAPWWLQILTVHGPTVFTSAAGTHGGLGGGFGRLVTELTAPLDDVEGGWLFYLAAYAGGGYAAIRRRLLLPIWAVSASYLIGKSRFVFVAGSMLSAVLIYELLVPGVRSRIRSTNGSSVLSTGLIIAVLSIAVMTGTLFAAGMTSAANGSSPSQPAFIDRDDRDAMAWMETSTERSARVVVLGDTAEWVPYFTDRTIVLGPWGVEWVSPDRYYEQLRWYKRVSTCPDASCIYRQLEHSRANPTYIYVPKGQYTVRGALHETAPGIRSSLATSDRFLLVYENEGVLIARVVGTPTIEADLRRH